MDQLLAIDERYKPLRHQLVTGMKGDMQRLQQLMNQPTPPETEIKALTARTRDRVDLVNAAIMKKSFRWTEFFTMLEGALPASSYISSMSPVTAVEGRFEIKFKVVSRTMGDLLQLTQNLFTFTGHPPLILNETRTGGQLVSEITLTYEKPH